MVLGTVVVVLREFTTLPPAASAGPVPVKIGENCGKLRAAEASAQGSTIKGTDGLLIRVRVPLNYDPTHAYPLLVVYPPAGFDRFASERYYGLTDGVTKHGWIVAYSDARPLSMRAVQVQAKVADIVAASYCIALDRIAYFGHSDGGALAQGVAELPSASPRPRAIVASGAGIAEGDLSALGCSGAVSAMIVHNRVDARFPDFGRGTVRHWAACGECQALDLAETAPNTCRQFQGCASTVHVAYCEVDTPHEVFPPIIEKAMDFLDRALSAVPND
jgi:polyhydroxybutyrate depolymerase